MSGVLLTVVVVMDRKIAQERVRATYFSKIITLLGVIVLDRSPGLPLGGVDRMRLELITNALKGRCSTIELPVPLCQSLPCTRRGGWMTQHT